MFARITTFTGTPEETRAGVETFREQALPWMREATGFRGWIAMVDPESGESVGISFWTDEAALQDEVASGVVLRDEVARFAGVSKGSTRVYEIAAVESLDLDD